MLSLQNVSQKLRDQFIFKHVSFTVQAGERIAIVGENGAGKTTLLHAILGFSRVTKGRITIDDKSVHHYKSWQGRCSYLPEKFQLYTHLSVLENLEYMVDLLRLPRDEIKRALSMTSMWEHREKRMNQLSKGMLQRTGLSIAIIGDPDWLVLDEPTSGLDPFGRRQLLSMLQQIGDQQKTILFTTHHMEEVKQLATHVLYIQDTYIQKMTPEHFFETVEGSFI